MIRIEALEPNQRLKEIGRVMDYRVLVGDSLLLEVDKKTEYHTTRWPVNLTAIQGIREVIAIAESFDSKYPDTSSRRPQAKVDINGVAVVNQPLDELQLDEELATHLLNPAFTLFRVDIYRKRNGIGVIYERTFEPELGVITQFDLSDLLPEHIIRTNPVAKSVNQVELSQTLQEIHRGFAKP